jgi:hypothetical protein
MSQVTDKENNEVIFDDEASYSLRQFIKIAKKSHEGKKMYKGDYNFGKGIKLAEVLRKELPQHKFECRVYRTAWNYGGNLIVSIELKGKDYKSKVFSFSSADSTKQPRYSFSDVFNGTIKPSDGSVEKDWGMGTIHGSYQSISQYDKFMTDIVGVFKDYKRVNGVEFDMKVALAEFKKNAKILADWNKLEDKIFKQYTVAKENARKVHRHIELRQPRLKVADKKVYYKTDEPRELRHPDEYGDYADEMLNSKEYAKYENAQAKISDIIEKFCAKHGFEFVWAANWYS